MPPIETTRLYYDDAYRWSFAASIIECQPVAAQHAVVLDATYFYPTSGGQPHDLGTIGPRAVADVHVRDVDGAVVHVVDGPLPLGPTMAVIDGPRRLDHMQQHTGQHILSRACIEVADATTIGFHLGRDYVSIDLDTPALTDDARDRIFALANEVVRRDDLIKAWFPTEVELATMALRKTPDVLGPLRIVAIGDFDQTACGGTHVARTGEVGLIHWLKTERLKRGVRVSFLAGDRARSDYATKHRIVQAAGAALACSAAEIPAAVDRLQSELAAAKKLIEQHHDEALDREAAGLAAAAGSVGPWRVIQQQWTGRSVDDIKGLAMRLADMPNTIALLSATSDRTQFVFSRPESAAVDLKGALHLALAAIGGGKGGGGRMVQGGGAAASPTQVDAALEAARAALLG